MYSLLGAADFLDTLGPFAAFGSLSLLVIGMFVKGVIYSKTTVPRGDYDARGEIIASQAKISETVIETLHIQTTSLNTLVTAVERIQKNGGVV